MSKKLQNFLLVVFTLLNALLVYLFLLQLPYGVDTFVSSLTHWAELSPRTGVAAAIAGTLVLITLVLVKRLPARWKSSLVYFRREHAHPGYRAFFGGKTPGFNRDKLLKAHPEIHDSGYNPAVQMQVWRHLHQRHAQANLVAGTASSWRILRNLYLVSLIFLSSFLLAWPLNFGVPLTLAMSYLFIYGAQTLFLLFSARTTGQRLTNNVLAVALKVK